MSSKKWQYMQEQDRIYHFVEKMIQKKVEQQKMKPQRAVELLQLVDNIDLNPDLGRRTSNRAFDNSDNEIGATILGYTGNPLGGDIHEWTGDLNATVQEVNSDRVEHLFKLANKWWNAKKLYDDHEDNVNKINNEVASQSKKITEDFREDVRPTHTPPSLKLF